MYESFYGLREKPFSMLPDPDFLYLSKKHQKALTLFEYGLMNNAGFCVISGDIGSGKTTILRKLLENMRSNISVGMITNTHNRFGELLDWVLSVYGIHDKDLSEVEKHQRFIDFLIEQYAAKKTTLLIVDEAQNMSADKLEELRMLSNINADKDQVLQIILAGQPELKETLLLPELKQFIQRIAVDYHLGPLDQEDTRAYIAHRLSVAGAESPIFTEEACDLIFKYSGGSPRLMNLLCDTAMVYGFADQQKVIDEDLVIEMILERMQNSLVPLACADLPKKKSRENVSRKCVAAQSASNVVEINSVDSHEVEHDFGEKVLRAAASEKEIEVEKVEKPEPEIEVEIKHDEEVQSHHAVDSPQDNISAEAEEKEPVKKEPVIGSTALPQSIESKRSRSLLPILVAIVVLVIATMFFSLRLDNDSPATDTATTDTTDTSKHENKSESIEGAAENLQQEVIQVIPEEIQKQLEEAQNIQQEMARRQQEDSDRLKILEEQAILLQNERDEALDKAKTEEAKRAAEAKAARISAKREKAAEKKAQQAIAEA
ncbi:MAG: AAA family ATPase, partial [Gammaproteobacteria bacterium]